MFCIRVTGKRLYCLNNVLKTVVLAAAYRKEIVKYVNDIQMFHTGLK
jgi:hypothetical protein